MNNPRIAERGFTHAWVSRVADGNGEAFFADVVNELVGPDDVVLDIGCGHGEFTMDLARRVGAAIGVDRDSGYLALARELADERHAANVRFLELEFSVPQTRLPLADASATAVVDRRGGRRFSRHTGAGGVALRHQRLVARFQLPAAR